MQRLKKDYFKKRANDDAHLYEGQNAQFSNKLHDSQPPNSLFIGNIQQLV